jgi:ADP-heptose:LPS heptosyltransferase
MIIISPYSKRLINGRTNPKNYPFWGELVQEISKTEHIVQVGIEGEEQLVPDFRKNLPVGQLRALIQECDTWISCDSFFQHLAWDEGKPGIVLWSVSDPLIYGHPENVNLLKSRDCLSENQFLWWEFVEHDPNKFVQPGIVMEALRGLLSVEKRAEIISNT